MRKTLDSYFDAMRQKRVAVLGIGVSNRPLIRLLLSHGVFVTACDKTPYDQLEPEVLELERAGAKLQVGEHYLDGLQADVVFRTPGMHPDTPALVQLREKGCTVTSEMEAFFALCPCEIIAVTGSDGKTTTTTLIAEILNRAGRTVWVGGNIGQPLLPLADKMHPTDVAVVELSSFQLMDMTHSPRVAVVTNLAPNHLDVHKDMAEYIHAKEQIFLHQRPGDRLVLNYDNDITRGFASKARGSVTFFSRLAQPEGGVWLDGETIYFRGEKVLERSDILLPGLHNVENYMAALAAVEGYAAAADVRAVAQTFGGVEHRIELVRELDGVRYYNDSIASSPSRTMAGLHAFTQQVILIAGGYDKHISFAPLGPEIVEHVQALILCGATAEKIRRAVEEAEGYAPGHPPIYEAATLAESVETAHAIAKGGDVVLLSPACAAFDQFKNFMVRGRAFKDLVAQLDGEGRP